MNNQIIIDGSKLLQLYQSRCDCSFIHYIHELYYSQDSLEEFCYKTTHISQLSRAETKLNNYHETVGSLIKYKLTLI